MDKYQIDLNWYGEDHRFHSNASSPKKARNHAIFRLARKLGIPATAAFRYFSNDKDNWRVQIKRRLR